VAQPVAMSTRASVIRTSHGDDRRKLLADTSANAPIA
jgi:hypothetical protein